MAFIIAAIVMTLTHFKFSVQIHRVVRNKSTSKQFRKSIHRCSQRV